jgi:hypothetical protein
MAILKLLENTNKLDEKWENIESISPYRHLWGEQNNVLRKLLKGRRMVTDCSITVVAY